MADKPILTNDFMRVYYDTEMPRRYEHYEFDRWFSSIRSWADYVMTYTAIRYHLKDVSFMRVLELGPGPGTWTQILFRKKPNAHFDLVDISKAMENEFRLEMRSHNDNVRYVVEDFEKYNSSEPYDLFFSSRAIEYFSDKQAALKKIFSLLSPGGVGIMVTKNQQHSTDHRLQHSAQMTAQELSLLLSQAGFLVQGIFPCVIRLPFIDRLTVRFSQFLFKKFFTKKFEAWQSRLVESFIVVFSKP